MDEENKYFFKGGLLFWVIILFIMVVNSGIISSKLPEELGGGARYIPKFEEKTEKQIAPKFENAYRDYKKEGEEALENSLK